MRVVSLLPAATEIVCALGAADELVGVSHECDYPAAVRRLPVVTRPRLDVHGSTAAIDGEVRALVAKGLAIYEIDVERLAALRPDVIVTQHQCDVCAVSYAEVEAAARAALGVAVTIVSLAPRVLADVWDDIERVAVALDRAADGRRVRDVIDARLGRLAAATAALERPTVACVEWIEPLMMAAHWTPELVAIAGGRYPFATRGEQSVVAEWAALLAEQPDVVVLAPCGFPIAQTQREIAALAVRPEWRALRAVGAGGVRIIDGNAYFNRPGPRLVESAGILAATLHPEACREWAIPDACVPIAC